MNEELKVFDEPLVSVIVPCHNGSKTLMKTLLSIRYQTYNSVEIIFIDDCSTDDSLSIFYNFLNSRKDDPLISEYALTRNTSVQLKKNKGVSYARNYGVKLAKGKYCAFLDADDMWETTKLQEHVNFLEANPEIGLSYDCSSFIDEEDNLLGLYQIPKYFDNLTAKYMLLRCPIGNGSSPVIRTDAIRKVLFDESLHHCEDLECWTRFYHQSGYKIAGINKLLTLYRISNNTASANTTNQINSLKAVLNKTSLYAPELIKQYGTLALAYQYRFVARRAIKDGKVDNAFTYINESLITDIRILVEEPIRTLITLIVAYLLKVTPTKLANKLKSFLFNLMSKKQNKLENN